MSQAFDDIAQGLQEAIAYARGNQAGARTHKIMVPETDVSAIRASTGLTQQDFANSIGVAVGTLRGWEQKRRRPEGPARVLLALIERQPDLVKAHLSDASPAGR
jgi:putative transcriptional regulator